MKGLSVRPLAYLLVLSCCVGVKIGCVAKLADKLAPQLGLDVLRVERGDAGLGGFDAFWTRRC